VEVQKASGFDHPTASSARLKVLISELPIPLSPLFYITSWSLTSFMMMIIIIMTPY